MKPIRAFNSIAAPLRGRNIDTDQIIPARFLKMNRQAPGGYGHFLFHDLSHLNDDCLRDDFVLNSPVFQSATILVAEQNFGCGSSREGAVYAFVDRGFQAIIAPSFGDIFFSNCLKNGLLPIQLPEDVVAALLDNAQRSNVGLSVTIDLENQMVAWTVGNGTLENHTFPIDPFWRECLLKGVDEIELTQSYMQQVEQFEIKHFRKNPWLCAQ